MYLVLASDGEGEGVGVGVRVMEVVADVICGMSRFTFAKMRRQRG